jgi:hypothetical protein
MRAYAKLLREELKEKIVERVNSSEVAWCNPSFLIPKPGGEWRKILDCRLLSNAGPAPPKKLQFCQNPGIGFPAKIYVHFLLIFLLSVLVLVAPYTVCHVTMPNWRAQRFLRGASGGSLAGL